ncbi:alpha-arabinofuranosidase [Actinoplanes sp. SE50]|uniref:family 43 glycosylhydrolase n=1 Tax=unclassified Actinoplanes TaxID=2626549 RepID=UPI00023EC4DC|nr:MULTISPECIES: family 43 glycosylhydrolase [unclassified Actinoplanes]AEV86406.1 alpha-N-arabinofuranosidase [Actinoplanes sp. SE50/110]ATO84803.1 alpha-arabinofuranosidase [Actinoplanes sp. SE50]SLM02213.1 alpha-arabinofuranosidase [Actinoplanes sp. SE50/110]
MNRRTLLLGGAAGALTTVLPAGAEGAPHADPVLNDAEIYGVPTAQPLISQRADPFISRRYDGKYYFTGSVPAYDRVVLRGSPTLAGLTTATETTIWTQPNNGFIWAPELHRIDDKWYVYFTKSTADDIWHIRPWVLESSLADPLDPSGWVLKGEIALEWDSFALDATTFAHRGRQYLVWAQSEPEIAVNTSIYIAELANPWTLRTKPVRLTTPTKTWEIQGFKVNEGPAVLVRNGRVFLTFSASATDANYCMGLLTADAHANLLDRASWVKSPDPIFTSDDDTQRWGPGHNSFTVAEDGRTDVLVYHARDYPQINGDPLYDPNRHTRVQKLYWHPDGTPLFGVPVGDGGPIVRLSAGRDFLHHGTTSLEMAPAPEDLGATQFRFVAAADGTETIRSVDKPSLSVRIDGTSVRLDPAGTPVRRIPARGGVTIRTAADPALFLRVDKGAIGTAKTGTVFRLS